MVGMFFFSPLFFTNVNLVPERTENVTNKDKEKNCDRVTHTNYGQHLCLCVFVVINGIDKKLYTILTIMQYNPTPP